MGLSIRRLNGNLGAEISDIDLSGPISAADHAAFYQAFLDSHVIVVRNQRGLSPAQVVAASRLLGELEPHLFEQYHHPETPLLLVLSNRTETDGTARGLADAGSFWHSDVSYKQSPAKATMLYAVETPDHGGDTLFCDMTAAYAALPEQTKRRIDGLTAVHNYAHTRRRIFDSGQVARPPDCIHPVVRSHPETGRKALYINPAYTVRIEDMDADAGEALKNELFEHCLQDRFRMRYVWRTGDVVAWDNAAVMHSATTKNLDPAKHRTLWRTIVSGGPTR